MKILLCIFVSSFCFGCLSIDNPTSFDNLEPGLWEGDGKFFTEGHTILAFDGKKLYLLTFQEDYEFSDNGDYVRRRNNKQVLYRGENVSADKHNGYHVVFRGVLGEWEDFRAIVTIKGKSATIKALGTEWYRVVSLQKIGK